jgi:long-subunit fatty acid transport protein
MKKILGATTALVVGTLSAQAGGIERATFNPAFLFENGNYFEVAFGSVSPSVSGVALGVASGDMASSYNTISGSVKYQITDEFAIGVVVDQPVGVDVAYPGGTGYFFSTSTAEVNSLQVSVLGHYRFSPNFSAYGGMRAVRTDGMVDNVNLGGGPIYDMSTSTETDYGYVVGVAYERPDIALRVALSYVSEVTHDFTASDSFGPGAGFATTLPQSVNLDFQTGVAADTLVFGSIRWRDWSEFTIAPRGGAIPLSTDNKDTVSYTLGVGRKFSDSFSGLASIGYEGAGGGAVGNLGPTDGYRSLTLAGIYTAPTGMKVTVGASYGWLGDATTSGIGGRFTDNNFVGVGVRVGYSF